MMYVIMSTAYLVSCVVIAQSLAMQNVYIFIMFVVFYKKGFRHIKFSTKYFHFKKIIEIERNSKWLFGVGRVGRPT